jgi:hypothetical protein
MVARNLIKNKIKIKKNTTKCSGVLSKIIKNLRENYIK